MWQAEHYFVFVPFTPIPGKSESKVRSLEILLVFFSFLFIYLLSLPVLGIELRALC
jgi:hypothetical protein